MLVSLALLGAAIWLIVFFLPWRPWSTKEQLDAREEDQSFSLSNVTVLIPARNEENEIRSTLESLKLQDPDLKIILVNDQSTDRTRQMAESVNLSNLKIIDGEGLQDGWAGKLWALEQGRKHVTTPYTLLMDADIQLKPGILKTLTKKLERENLGYVSLMAELRMKSFWEKLLIPAYIYFFKLLYPFAISNSNVRFLGVAAGGCNLVRTEALEKIGGFGALKGAFIDDCSLASLIKSYGYASFTGLTHSVISHRAYTDLREIWNLIARFAYTYLKYSFALLFLCSLLMLSAFVFLPLGLFLETGLITKAVLIAGFIAMFFCYYPTARYYRLGAAWFLSIPFAGQLYLLMTWSSAYRYYRGRRTEWKGRTYTKDLKAVTSFDKKDAA